MGAYLGVAQGSLRAAQVHPPHVHAAPARAAARGVIGKGITFDSGGLDLKSADGMLRMKDDMSGAAAVLGVFSALPALQLPVEVHGLIAATENMPSGTAQRPGDIVRAMNGLTIEIGNTDAEGRLTLADALAYAAREIKPDEMIDLATLTGAVVIALGPQVTGIIGEPRRPRPAAARRGRQAGGAHVAAAAPRRVQGRPQERHRRPQQHLEPARGRQHRGRAVHARVHRRASRGRTSTSRAPPSPSATWALGPKGATGVGGADAPDLPRRARRGRASRMAVTRWRAASTCTRTRRRPTARSRRASSCGRRPGAGVRVLAVTDHDSTEGLARGHGRGRARIPPLTIVPGIEINCDVEGAEIHVLGYAMDYRGPVVPGLLPRPAARSGARACVAWPSGSPTLGMPIDAGGGLRPRAGGLGGSAPRGPGDGRARLREDGARGLRPVPRAGQARLTCRAGSSRRRTRCGCCGGPAASRCSRTPASRAATS